MSLNTTVMRVYSVYAFIQKLMHFYLNLISGLFLID